MDLTTSNPLPPDSRVDVSILSQLFNHTTNSYKLLFFFALLDTLERTGFQPSTPMSVSDLVLDMLVNAWYPHIYFKLSFGKADKTTSQLDRLTVESIERSGQKFSAWNKERIRSCIASAHIDGGDLARYVPYRLVRPFFPETNGAKDHLVNGMVAEMCNTYFADRKPLYRFHGADALEFNADWCTYLRDNLSIVKGWAAWNYLQCMQKANPLVPNLSLKLFLPAERESLASQTKFWNTILEASAVTCIYTGERLTPKHSRSIISSSKMLKATRTKMHAHNVIYRAYHEVANCLYTRGEKQLWLPLPVDRILDLRQP